MPTVNLAPTNPDELVVVGPTLEVQIGFDPGHWPNGASLPAVPQTLYPALLDTGAFTSCIDADLASELDLIVVDRQWISGVGGSLEVNVYAAQFVIPSLPWVIYGEFAGVNLQAGGQRHAALIGRTFLRHQRLVYDGRTGTVTLGDP